MRMSCNGCRVLRKGCSDDCSIRPCLQWIKNPEAQANATVFLAKFYGRAGLVNLIDAGPQNLRPAVFRSLLYEACGRVVNPIYGAVGLLWSGKWDACQAAVQAVLRGEALVPVACDIRHDADKVSKSRATARSKRREAAASHLSEEEAVVGLDLTLGFEYNYLKPARGDE